MGNKSVHSKKSKANSQLITQMINILIKPIKINK